MDKWQRSDLLEDEVKEMRERKCVEEWVMLQEARDVFKGRSSCRGQPASRFRVETVERWWPGEEPLEAGDGASSVGDVACGQR